VFYVCRHYKHLLHQISTIEHRGVAKLLLLLLLFIIVIHCLSLLLLSFIIIAYWYIYTESLATWCVYK